MRDIKEMLDCILQLQLQLTDIRLHAVPSGSPATPAAKQFFCRSHCYTNPSFGGRISPAYPDLHTPQASNPYRTLVNLAQIQEAGIALKQRRDSHLSGISRVLASTTINPILSRSTPTHPKEPNESPDLRPCATKLQLPYPVSIPNQELSRIFWLAS
ncbi:Uncharacterized protein HZ326_5218 [Fusarium oxysporum f. sp. albedinis]|nr:Uncharacterized protein HZ326_5218 [Fusarium oxysporum f. sp. albedinis]